MKKETYKVTDRVAARLEAQREKARFSFIEDKVKQIQEKNLPLYLQIIWDNLDKGGEKLLADYLHKFSNEHYQDLSNLQVKNYLSQKFGMLADPFHRFRYNKKFLILHEDGSFELNEEAIDEHYQKLYTYEITKEQYDAIQSIKDALNTLGMNPNYVKSYFYVEDKEIKIKDVKLYALLSSGQRSTFTM